MVPTTSVWESRKLHKLRGRHYCLHNAEAVIPFRHLRGFLTEGVHVLVSGELGDEEENTEPDDFVKTVHGRVKRIMAFTPYSSGPSMTTDPWPMILQTTIVKLKEISCAGKQFSQDLKDLNGDRILPDTAIWFCQVGGCLDKNLDNE